MKTLITKSRILKKEGRWDIDYHLPPIGIREFDDKSVQSVRDVADVVKAKRDPTKHPENSFLYVDISSVDVESGLIVSPQELTGEEAPSRARKVIHAYDVIISTCRPTRGAIAIVPEHLHGQICSTGFSVIRAKPGTNPFFLHYVLRLPSTLEQFRKWSTGSSYPAILDEDVLKTRIPYVGTEEQDKLSCRIRVALSRRQEALRHVNEAWQRELEDLTQSVRKGRVQQTEACDGIVFSAAGISERLIQLGSVAEEMPDDGDEDEIQELLFGDLNSDE